MRKFKRVFLIVMDSFGAGNAKDAEAVSYTHLDVYKRQLVSSDSGRRFVGNGSRYFESNQKCKCSNWLYYDELHWNVYSKRSG